MNWSETLSKRETEGQDEVYFLSVVGAGKMLQQL